MTIRFARRDKARFRSRKLGALLLLVARIDIGRRVAISTIGPMWKGNQVWFVLGGGPIFMRIAFQQQQLLVNENKFNA